MTGTEHGGRRSAAAVGALARQWAPTGRDAEVVELIGLLRSAALAVTEGPDEVLARHGLSRPRFDVLAALYRAAPAAEMTQAELADQMLVSPAGMKKRLDGLLDDGLVDRLVDPADGRRQPLRLTPKGVRLVEGVLDDFFAAEAAAVAPLGSAGRHELVSLLRVLLG